MTTLAAPPSAPLERDDELSALRTLLLGAHRGAGGLVLVEGAAGIGKTRLLAEAAKVGRGAGFAVLAARGGEYERDFPFGIARQLFEAPVRSADADERRRLLMGAAGPVRPLLLGISGGGEDPGTPAGGPSSPPLALLHGLYWLAAGLADRQPLLITIDDLHWSDVPSLRFLVYLARRAADLPVALVVATRPAEDDERRTMLLTVTSPPNVVLHPAPLSRAAVTEVAERVLGPAEAPFAAALHEATGGNPFLIGELISVLAARDIAPTAEAVATLEDLAPDAVGRAVAARLARLDEPARRLARALAILEEAPAPSLPAALAGIEIDDAARAADALADADVLMPGRPLRFLHPLVRAAVRALVPAGEASIAHARAADLLREEGAPPEAIAVHLARTDPRHDVDTVVLLRAAARRALARGAPATAAAWLRRALDEPPPPEERPQVLLEAGLAAAHAFSPESDRLLEEAAQVLEEPADRVEALLGRLRHISDYYGEATGLLERAREAAAALPGEQRRRVEAFAWMFKLELVPGTAAEVLRLVHAADPPLTGADAGERALLAASVPAGVFSCEPAEAVMRRARLAWADGALVRDAGVEDPLWSEMALACAQLDPWLVGRWADAAEVDVRRSGSAAGWYHLYCVRVGEAGGAGEVARVEDILRRMFDLEGTTINAWQGGIELVMVNTLLMRDRVAEARAHWDQSLLAAALRDGSNLAVALVTRALVREFEGDIDGAIADVEAALVDHRRFDGVLGVGMPAHYARLLALAGRREEARAAAEPELERGRAAGNVMLEAWALIALGLAQEDEASRIEVLRQCVALTEGTHARLCRAGALVELGAAMRRTGMPRDAREPLAAARDLAHRLGADHFTRRATEELLAAGGRPRRVQLSGPESLTAAERRTADLAAAGRTNREIAQQLFVTEKTVESQLRAAYMKLGIKSRRDLPGALGSGAGGAA